MDILLTKKPEYLKIELIGDLDASTSMNLDHELAQALKNSEKHILVDCNNLYYISSAGLGVFMSYIQDFNDNNVFFALFGLSNKVKNVFSILGLEKLIKTFDNEADAASNF